MIVLNVVRLVYYIRRYIPTNHSCTSLVLMTNWRTTIHTQHCHHDPTIPCFFFPVILIKKGWRRRRWGNRTPRRFYSRTTSSSSSNMCLCGVLPLGGGLHSLPHDFSCPAATAPQHRHRSGSSYQRRRRQRRLFSLFRFIKVSFPYDVPSRPINASVVIFFGLFCFVLFCFVFIVGESYPFVLLCLVQLYFIYNRHSTI